VSDGNGGLGGDAIAFSLGSDLDADVSGNTALTIRGGYGGNSYATGTVSGSSNVGGLVGANAYSTVSNSYATGAVTGSSSVGGVTDYGLVSNSHAAGKVSGSSNIGGLLGYNESYLHGYIMHRQQAQECPQSPVIPGSAQSHLRNLGENSRLVR